MALIRPTRAEMRSLAEVYRETLAPGAAPAIAKLRRAGVRLVLVSGGFRPAIAPVAKELGFEDTDLFAVDVYWKESGEYAGFETSSPLTTQNGKLQIVLKIGLERPTLGVGDGSTDLGMRPGVDEFAAFTGFARREVIVRDADLEIASYDELVRYVLDSDQKATTPHTNFHE
jgi:phosphoserine phosphatase